MNNEKAKIPREVAEAIEKSIEDGFSNMDILYDLTSGYYDFTGKAGEWLENGGDFDVLLSALVNGYTIEQTPEDKVREYFERLCKETQPSCGNRVEDRVRASVACQAVEFTLNTLGIKIEGVNA